jgi:hypothetical protein
MNKSAISKTLWSKWLLWLALPPIAFMGFLVILNGIPLVSASHVRATIAQNLPLGSSPEAVIYFLDAQHIPHSGYVPDIRRIYAEIGRSSIGLMEGHINIQFEFNRDGKLISYKVQEGKVFL